MLGSRLYILKGEQVWLTDFAARVVENDLLNEIKKCCEDIKNVQGLNGQNHSPAPSPAQACRAPARRKTSV